MADINKLSVRITGDESGLKRATKEAQRDINTLSNSALSFGKIMGGTAIGSLLGNTIPRIFSKISQAVSGSQAAFNEASSSMTKLATVMTQRGATQKQYDEIIALTNAEERLGVVSASAMQNGLQELATYVGKAESLKKLTNTMNNLVVQQHGYEASSYNVLQTATMMGKVLQGQTGGMERIGYHLDEAEKELFNFGTEEERVALLTSIVNENLGNMNRALGQTDAGKQIQLANTWEQLRSQVGELATAIGNYLIPAFSAVANAVGHAIAYIKAFFKLFGVQIGNSAANTAGVVSNAADAVDDYGNAAQGAAKKAKKALAAFDEMNVLTEQTASSAGAGGDGFDILGDIEASAQAINWDSLIPDIKLPKWVDDLKNAFDFDKIAKAFQKFAKRAQKFLEPLGKILSDIWNKYLLPFLTWTGNDALPAFLNAIGGALEFLGALIDRIWSTALEPLITNFLGPIAAFTGGVIVKVLNAIGDALSWIANQSGVITLLSGIAVAIGTVKAAQLAWNAAQSAMLTISTTANMMTGTLTQSMGALAFQLGASTNNMSMMVQGAQVAGTGLSGLAVIGKGLLETVFSPMTIALEAVTAAYTAFQVAVEYAKLKEMEAETAEKLRMDTTKLAAQTQNQYNDAIEESQRLLNELAGKEASAAEAELNWRNLVEQAQKKRKEYNDALKAGHKSTDDLRKMELEAIVAENRAKEAKDKLSDAQQAVNNHLTEYDNQQWKAIQAQKSAEAQALLTAGKYEELAKYLDDLSNSTIEYKNAHGQMAKFSKEDTQSMASYISQQLGKVNEAWNQAYDIASDTSMRYTDIVNMMSKNGTNSGTSFATGVAKGIKNNQKAINDAAVKSADSAKAAFNKALKIQSPSRVMAESGRYFIEGIESGIDKETTALERNVAQLGETMVKTFNANVQLPQFSTDDVADKLGRIASQAQVNMDVNAENTAGAIESLAKAIVAMQDDKQPIVVKIGEETLVDTIIDGINNASEMRNRGVINI